MEHIKRCEKANSRIWETLQGTTRVLKKSSTRKRFEKNGGQSGGDLKGALITGNR